MGTRHYKTSQGDLWDTISLRVYGTEKLMHLLIEANPEYRNIAVFPANCKLQIPDAPRGERVAFPPWRAGNND